MKNAQRSILMKKTVSYNIKKVLAGTMLVALPFAFGGCEKENTKPNDPSNPQQTTYTIEYIYDTGLNFHRNGSTTTINHTDFVDTIAKHAANQQVKQIHMIPESQYMLETSIESAMVARANDLNNMYNVSNNKLSGENTTLVLDSAAFHNSTVQNVLHNKLKIALVQR